jgi:hypothetical protein
MPNPLGLFQHPSDTDLLLYIDGELSSAKTTRIKKHIDQCWRCRRVVQQMQETISGFVNYLDNEYTPSLSPPPHGWNRFPPMLSQLGAADRPAVRRILSSLGFRAVAIAGLIVVLVVYLTRIPAVSAKEILTRAVRSERTATKSVRTVSMVSRGRRVVRTIARDHPRPAIVPSDDSRFENELQSLYEANQLDWGDPLSATAFARWHDGLTRKLDSIRTTADGITLQTINEAAVAPGTIMRAELGVRKDDYHSVREALWVKGSLANFEIEVREVFSTASPQEGDTKVVAQVPTVPNRVADSRSPLPAIEPKSTSAGPELELEALTLLHSVGGDLGQEASISHLSNGHLQIAGVIDEPSRRTELFTALAPLAGNPQVEIKLLTTQDALKNLPPAHSSEPIGATGSPVSGAIPAEPLLSTYFSRRGTPQERVHAEIRKFCQRIVDTSETALVRAMALHDLGIRFHPEELAPPARRQWNQLVQDHARAFSSVTYRLQEELIPVFPTARQKEQAAPVAVPDSTISTINELFQLAKQNDEAVRAAFTLTSDVAPPDVLSAGFWQDLRKSESLAAALYSPDR